MVEDVLALLPQDEIFMLFFEKLDSSPKFATFVQSIGDASFHRKYTTLWVGTIKSIHFCNTVSIKSEKFMFHILLIHILEIEGASYG